MWGNPQDHYAVCRPEIIEWVRWRHRFSQECLSTSTEFFCKHVFFLVSCCVIVTNIVLQVWRISPALKKPRFPSRCQTLSHTKRILKVLKLSSKSTMKTGRSIRWIMKTVEVSTSGKCTMNFLRCVIPLCCVYIFIKYAQTSAYSREHGDLLFIYLGFLCNMQMFLSLTSSVEVWRVTQARGKLVALTRMCLAAALGTLIAHLASVKESPASLSSSTG